MMEKLEVLILCISIFYAHERPISATLTIRQGRITTSPQVSVELIPVVGIATVELGGSAASRPTYYFDCITNLNNGSGIAWTRMSTQLRFDVESIPDGSPGKRLNVGGLDFPDLDIYTCSDQYSDDVASVNITAFNPAIMAAEKSVSVVQGSTAALEVYVSGYPIPTSSQITWYYPNDNMVLDTDTGVEFQDTGRRLILSNVQPQQVGAYDCKVVLSDMNATTTIELNVYILLDQPTVRTVPRYNYITRDLISINTTILSTMELIDGFIGGSPVQFEVVHSSYSVDLSMISINNCQENITIQSTSQSCKGNSCSVTFMLSSSSCPPPYYVNTSATVTAVHMSQLVPGQPTGILDGGTNRFFHATLPSVLTLSNRRVTCFFFESFADVTCEFFKCSAGNSCQQLELVNAQSGTGNTVTFLIEVTQFQINDTVEVIVRGSNEAKSVDIQGMLTIDIEGAVPDQPCTAVTIRTTFIAALVCSAIAYCMLS